MNKYSILILSIISFTTISCTSMVIPQKPSNLNIIKANTNEIKITPSNIFYSGYYSDSDYFMKNNSLSIGLTDSVCYYSILGNDEFFVTPVKPFLFNLSKNKDNSTSLFFTNISKIDFPIDDWILKKMDNHNQNYKSDIKKSQITIFKTDFEYNSDSFNHDEKTDISYMLRLRRSLKTSCLFLDAANIIADGMPVLGEVVYVESFPKNVIINNVELKSEIIGSLTLSEYNYLRWDFKKLNDTNILIIYYDKHPGRVTFRYDLKITGYYLKNK